MADDPYEVLGLARDADRDAIRKAYRRLAKETHPDLHPGDEAAAERFKRIGAANALLSDPERRARFDRGEIDAAGQEPPPPGRSYRDYAQEPQGRRYRPGAGAGPAGASPFDADGDEENLGDILGDLFNRGRRAPPGGPRRGADHEYALTVPFADAVTGATTRITLPGGATLDVRIPPGLEDGQVLRLRGKGGEGTERAPAGDALIRVAVAADPRFTRDNDDIRTELPVGLREAVLGGTVTVPTPAGPVAMTVPPDSDTGRILRLRGRGVPARGDQPAGNLLVTLRVVLGPADATLKDFLRGWTPPAPGGAA